MLPYMKRFTVSSKKSTTPKKFQPERLANRLLLDSGFDDGKEAQVKYSNGTLTVIVGKKPKNLE